MTDDLRARLEEDQRIIEAATGGPWENEGGGEIGQHYSTPEPWKDIVSTQVACWSYCLGGSAEGVIEDHDAEFIAASRTRWEQANRALLRVLSYLDEMERLGDAAASLLASDIRRAIEEAMGDG